MFQKPKPYNIAQQMAGIKTRFPAFNVTINKDELIAYGSIQPTERSVVYDIRIKYRLKDRPQIIVLNPILKRNSQGEKIPHMYGQKSLCLYRPKYGQFTSSDLICDTIIPWTSLWLYHYETWHITGEWKGGGEHPE